MSLLWLDACDTLLSLLADCNFSLAFPCANPLKAMPGKKTGKKYFDDLFSVIFEIKEKYVCSLQKFTLVGKYE